MRKLEEKVAVVTGAGSGQGRAVSILFAREGARVVVADIDETGGRETVAAIERGGGVARLARADVSQLADVQQMIRLAVADFGGVDILYNNAARNRPDTPIPETVAEMPEEHWSGTIETNLTGIYYASKYAIPEMIRRGGGVIINVSSSLGLCASENQSAYVASKHGVIGLTKAMAIDYGPRGIRVNAICPGAIDTPRFNKAGNVYDTQDFRKRITAGIPLRRIGEPEEIAKVALFLACDDSSYVSGSYVAVDGGMAGRR